jgi:hypothetical protein
VTQLSALFRREVTSDFAFHPVLSASLGIGYAF